MNVTEKLQAVFTWKRKRPNFKSINTDKPKDKLNYEMPNYSL